ncbi:MAG: flagellar export chaperone FliS [Phycisphaerales bacterium]|nr:MAG: flagellar export chaperone FliS [Phycisphaerales bacterium]
MTASTPNAYLRTQVMTANPAELRLMLFDGAIRFAEQGREGLGKKDYEQAYNGVTRCQAILMELINSLCPEQDPDLCRKLSALYTFMYTRLMNASSERNPAIVDEVLNLLRYERETWSLLMKKLVKENAAASLMQSSPARPAAGVTGRPAEETGNLVGGRVSLQG